VTKPRTTSGTRRPAESTAPEAPPALDQAPISGEPLAPEAAPVSDAPAAPDQAPIPAPPWASGRDRQRRRRTGPALEREHIVAAALAIVDADGAAALSIRGVAAALDAAAMSLYWHVRDKAQLEDLVGEAVLESIVVPPRNPDWRADLRAVHQGMRVAVERHPNAVELTIGRARYGRAGVALFERILATLLDAGFTPDAAFAAYDVLYLFTLGYIATASRTPAFVSAQLEGLVYLRSLPADLFPAITAVAPVILGRSQAVRFDTALDVILAGIEAELASRGPAPHLR
jgi:TetR/AcrR family transcriptional regulator, tetracycline repressor protein